MTTFDLTKFNNSDGFVLHFGGRPNEVDTYTFANALVAFSDAFREVNSQINQSISIELKLEAVGPGSFRGKIKGVPKSIKGALKLATNVAILPLLMSFIYDNYIDNDTFEIEISDDYVIITQGGDRTIIPRTAYEASKALPTPNRVHEKINQVIDAVEDDVSIQGVGLTLGLEDKVPAINLDRATWATIRKQRTSALDDQKERVEQEEVELSILKVVFASGRRKWEFVWRGIKISAYIDDPIFIADIMAGIYKIGNGDSIRCILDIGQEWSDENRVWLNTSYSISKVLEFIPKKKTGELFDREL